MLNYRKYILVNHGCHVNSHKGNSIHNPLSNTFNMFFLRKYSFLSLPFIGTKRVINLVILARFRLIMWIVLPTANNIREIILFSYKLLPKRCTNILTTKNGKRPREYKSKQQKNVKKAHLTNCHHS